MNREEILAMEAGVELDNQIAVLMGEDIYQDEVGQWLCKSSSGKAFDRLVDCYSTDIPAAWQVKKKLNSEGLLLTLTDLCPTGPLYRAEFWGYMGLVPTKMFGKAEADSASEAICKAALLTKSGN